MLTVNLESEQNKSICHYVVTHCPCHARNKDLHSQTELDLDKNTASMQTALKQSRKRTAHLPLRLQLLDSCLFY